MLYEGRRIGSLIYVGTGVENIKEVGTREVHILKNLMGDRVYVASPNRVAKISEEDLIEIVNAEYPL